MGFRGFATRLGSFHYLFLLLGIISCSALNESKPVSLPVPFSGALAPDSRAVVVEGDAVAASTALKLLEIPSDVPCTRFSAFESDGAQVGTCEYCETGLISSTPISDGRRDQFTMPARCHLDGGNLFESRVECVDYPHADPTIAPPTGSGLELRKGLCAGFILQDGVETEDHMVGKYVMFSKNMDGKKQFARQLKAVWTLDGGLVKKDETSKDNEILALLFENNSPFFDIPDNGGGTATLLFCEGRTNSMGELAPCGMVGYTELDFLEVTPQRVDLFTTAKVCHCAAPDTEFEQSSESCLDLSTGLPSLVPPDCSTVTRPHFLLHVLPGVSYDDGIPMVATMTEHDPVDCNKATGALHDICLNDGLNLDYRCQAILKFDEQENFLGFSRSIGGSYIISRPAEGQ